MIKKIFEVLGRIKGNNFPYEEPLFSLLKKELPSNPVIFESGAHIGYDTARMSAFWPKATIHSFEPNPYVYKKLKKEVRFRSNIYTYPLAIGQTDGESEMHISQGKSDASSSLLKPKLYLSHPEISFSETIKVPTSTINTWASKNKIDRIDFMWLDMQGGEYPALLGASSILGGVKAIYTEINLQENYEGNVLYPQLKEWLENAGFEEVLTEIKFEDSGNALFLRKK